MEHTIIPIKKTTISYEIIDWIIGAISTGELKVGDRLPSERDLAARMQVSRSSVREAIKMLSFNRIIESRTGAGTFIINTPFDPAPDTSAGSSFQLDDQIVQSIEVRMLIEPGIIRLAAVNITDQELEKVDALIAQMTPMAENNDFGGYSLLDMQLHHLFALATKNPAFYHIQQNYSGSSLHVTSFNQAPGTLLFPDRQHHDIIQALHRHDPDEAEQHMKQHIYYAFHNTFHSGIAPSMLHQRLELLSSATDHTGL